MSVPLLPAGVLVAFEGIDGAGKTTQAAHLAAYLARAADAEVVRTKEPTDGPWGRRLRASAATGRLSPGEELHAFLEDRREHVASLIRPALARGAAVIVDRYYFSTAAYQGARGRDPDELLTLNESFAPEPDLLVLLEVTAAVGVARIRARDARENLFEREADLARSAAIFAAMRRPYLLRLDGALPVDALAATVAAAAARLPPVAARLAAAAPDGAAPAAPAGDAAPAGRRDP